MFSEVLRLNVSLRGILKAQSLTRGCHEKYLNTIFFNPPFIELVLYSSCIHDLPYNTFLLNIVFAQRKLDSLRS